MVGIVLLRRPNQSYGLKSESGMLLGGLVTALDGPSSELVRVTGSYLGRYA